MPLHNGKKNERLVCADRFSMSVQAGFGHYCNPRNDSGPYKQVEVGFPSEKEEMLMDYADQPHAPTRSIYGWVPVSVVTLVIAKHGGVISGELPPGIPMLRAEDIDGRD